MIIFSTQTHKKILKTAQYHTQEAPNSVQNTKQFTTKYGS